MDGRRTSSGWLWVCVSAPTCASHTRAHAVSLWMPVALHGLACKRSAGRHPRHSLLNDVVWRAMLRAQVPSCKEPAGLSRSDGKRGPDGVSLIPWSRDRCVWPGTSRPPTPSPHPHLPSSATQAGSAAARAEAAKTLKYSALAITHVFVPLAFETLSTWGLRRQHLWLSWKGG